MALRMQPRQRCLSGLRFDVCTGLSSERFLARQRTLLGSQLRRQLEQFALLAVAAERV